MTPLDIWRALSPSQRDALADLCLAADGVPPGDQRRANLQRAKSSRTMAVRSLMQLRLATYMPDAPTEAGRAVYGAGCADNRRRRVEEEARR